MKGPPRSQTVSSEEWQRKILGNVDTRLMLLYSCSVMNYFSWVCLLLSMVCKITFRKWDTGWRFLGQSEWPSSDLGASFCFGRPQKPSLSWGCLWGSMFFGKDGKHIVVIIRETLSCWLSSAKADMSLLMSNGRSQGSRRPQPSLQSGAGVSRRFLPTTATHLPVASPASFPSKPQFWGEISATCYILFQV